MFARYQLRYYDEAPCPNKKCGNQHAMPDASREDYACRAIIGTWGAFG
jgi:hypothetical protein